MGNSILQLKNFNITEQMTYSLIKEIEIYFLLGTIYLKNSNQSFNSRLILKLWVIDNLFIFEK